MRTAVRVLLVTLIWAPLFVFAGRLASGGPEAFGGYALGAQATATQWHYDQPSLGVPAQPTGEISGAFSQTTLESGPAGYAIASGAWPGQVAAAVPSFVQGEIEGGIEGGGGPEGFFPTDVPNYPVRAESFYPQGPKTASSGGGTTRMKTSAHETVSESETIIGGMSFPGLGGAGSQISRTTTAVDGNVVVSTAYAEANDVSVAAGLITIEQVVTKLTARSDGTKATVEGATRATGVKFMDAFDAALDETGMHAGGEPVFGASVINQQIDGGLNSAGIEVSVSEPIDTKNGPEATRAVGGVLVRFKPSAVSALGAPDDVPQDQVVTLAIAPAVVKVNAAPAFEFEIPPPAAGGATTGGGTTGDGATTGATTGSPTDAGSPAGGATGGGSVGGSPSDGGTGTTADGTGGESFGAVPVGAPVPFGGLGAAMLAGFTLFALASTKPLIMAADRMLAARAGAACPYETG